MKTRIILCIIGLLGILMIPPIAAYSQPIPLLQGNGEFVETGCLDRDSTGKVIDVWSDTVVACNVPIKIYEDALVIDNALSQDFSFGSILNRVDNIDYYLIMYEAVDNKHLKCNVIVYQSRVTGTHVITINYKNMYYRYYL